MEKKKMMIDNLMNEWIMFTFTFITKIRHNFLNYVLHRILLVKIEKVVFFIEKTIKRQDYSSFHFEILLLDSTFVLEKQITFIEFNRISCGKAR